MLILFIRWYVMGSDMGFPMAGLYFFQRKITPTVCGACSLSDHSYYYIHGWCFKVLLKLIMQFCNISAELWQEMWRMWTACAYSLEPKWQADFMHICTHIIMDTCRQTVHMCTHIIMDMCRDLCMCTHVTDTWTVCICLLKKVLNQTQYNKWIKLNQQ